MKSYKEINDDIRSKLSSEITGTPLDILVNILSMYTYNVQASAVSQLMEGNIDTAVSMNSLILKAAQYGVSLPRVMNPEVEFQVKSTGSSHTIYPGDEVISIGKFKFLYIGYYSGDEFITDHCEVNPSNGTLIRCVISDKVTVLNVDNSNGVIYDESISHVASKVFVYKGTGTGEVCLNVYDSYREYLADSGIDKILSVTYPDYGIKLIDENSGNQASYRVIVPNELPSITEVLSIIKGKAASKYVTVSATRQGSEDQNIKIVNLGSEVLNKTDAIAYIENNLKLTQLIKSNSDINAFFEKYIFTYTSSQGIGLRCNVSFIIGNYLDIYVDNDRDPRINDIDTSGLEDMFYINLQGVRINFGYQIIPVVKLKLNNPVDDELDELITSYISEYDGKFNTLIDEYDLIAKINSINPLIRIMEFVVEYTAMAPYMNGSNRELRLIQLSATEWTVDVPNLDFIGTGRTPVSEVVYKLYIGKDKYLKPRLEWI